MSLKKYNKKFKTTDELINLLTERGLDIDIGREEFVKYLESINYYRLTGYALPFLKDRENFVEGSKASDLIRVYNFDREFRDLLSEGLEVVELTLRTILAREFSRKYGPLGYRSRTNFQDAKKFRDHLSALDGAFGDSQAMCALALKAKYKDPPFWAIIECSTFGVLGRIYENMHRPDQSVIAQIYGFGNGAPMLSYLTHLISLRNICAHHGRLYDLSCPFRYLHHPASYPYTFSPLDEWKLLHGKQIIKLQKMRTLFEQFALVYRMLSITDNKPYDRESWRMNVSILFERFAKENDATLVRWLGAPDEPMDSPLWI